MTEFDIIQQELAKHGKVPATAKPATTAAKKVAPVEEKTKPEPKVVSAVEPKKTKVTVQLTDQEVAGLTRESNLLGQTWQEHFGTLVLEMLDKRVAKTLISGPSYSTKKVTGPSQFGAHFNGH